MAHRPRNPVVETLSGSTHPASMWTAMHAPSSAVVGSVGSRRYCLNAKKRRQSPCQDQQQAQIKQTGYENRQQPGDGWTNQQLERQDQLSSQEHELFSNSSKLFELPPLPSATTVNPPSLYPPAITSIQADTPFRSIHLLIAQKAQVLSVDELLTLEARIRARDLQYAEKHAEIARRTIELEKNWWEKRRELEEQIATLRERTLEKELDVLRERQAASKYSQSRAVTQYHSISEALKMTEHITGPGGIPLPRAPSKDPNKKRRIDRENELYPRYSEHYLSQQNYVSRTEIVKRLFLNAEGLNPGHRFYHNVVLDADAHHPESRVSNRRWNSPPYWPFNHAMELITVLLAKYKDGEEMYGVVVKLNSEFLLAWRKNELVNRKALLSVPRVTDYVYLSTKQSTNLDDSSVSANSQIDLLNKTTDDTDHDASTPPPCFNHPCCTVIGTSDSHNIHNQYCSQSSHNSQMNIARSLSQHFVNMSSQQIDEHSRCLDDLSTLPPSFHSTHIIENTSDPHNAHNNDSDMLRHMLAQNDVNGNSTNHTSQYHHISVDDDISAFVRETLRADSTPSHTVATSTAAAVWLSSSSSLTSALSFAVPETYNINSPSNPLSKHRSLRHVRSRSLSIPLPITDPTLYMSPPSPLGMVHPTTSLLRDTTLTALDLHQHTHFPAFMDLALLGSVGSGTSGSSGNTSRLLGTGFSLSPAPSTECSTNSFTRISIQQPLLDTMRATAGSVNALEPSSVLTLSSAKSADVSKLDAPSTHLHQFQLNDIGDMPCTSSSPAAEDLMHAIMLPPVLSNSSH